MLKFDMNSGCRHTEPRFGEMDSAAELRPSRLSRKHRRSQMVVAETGSPRNHGSEFKTPTRTVGSRAATGFSAESPQNESEVQQDIIWDATSPSPNRLGGKRGRRHVTGFVNISEIVNRIAPKSGRPEVTEPTLQQWIGDSATIPCTPDIQVPKPKKKSPRATAVDDLLKLAKQFDFTMFRQGEEDGVEDVHQQSLELLSEDDLDFEDHKEFSQPSPETDTCRLHLDRHTNDDFDCLFREPTQHISGNFSLSSSAQLSGVKPTLAEAPSAGGLLDDGTDIFVDDWENDDLLNDSLVLDMTQNPQKFSTLKYCPPSKGGAVVTRSAIFRAEKENVRPRAFFRLESNPNLSVTTIQSDKRTQRGGDIERSGFLYDVGFPVETRSQQQTSKTEKSKVFSSTSTSVVISDVQDEDLDVFFSSEPMWDDPADDQIQSSSNNNKAVHQRAALQPANQQPVPQKDTPTWFLRAAAGLTASSLAAGSASNITAGANKNQFTLKKLSIWNSTETNKGMDSFNCTPKESLWSGGGVVPPVTAAPPPLRNNKAAAVRKCSASEIELKKQQALERRQQRLLEAAHHLPPDHT